MQQTKSTIPGAQGVEPTAGDRDAVWALIRRQGEAKTCATLGVDRFTLCRLAAALPVREATLAHARARLYGSGQPDSKQLKLPLGAEA